MPSKKKKYNARFPAGRIKKIMQTDDEVGKVAQAVPVIISRTLELFVESLLTKAQEITSAKNAKTLSPSHMKQCILSESRFDFLKELVASLPDVVTSDYEEGSFPVIPPPVGSTNTSDATRSYPRKVEKQLQHSVPSKDAMQESPREDCPATSSTIAADFYKETLNNINSSSSVGSGVNSTKDVSNNNDELDEDYDTT